MIICPSSTRTSPSPPKSVTFQPSRFFPLKRASLAGAFLSWAETMLASSKARTQRMGNGRNMRQTPAECRLFKRSFYTVAEPLDILADALGDIDFGFVTEQAAGFGEVGVGEGHVFGAGGVVIDSGFGAGGLLNELNQPANGDG